MNTTFKDGLDKLTQAEDLNWVLKPWDQVSETEVQHPAYKYGLLLDKVFPGATFEVNHYQTSFSEDTDEIIELTKVSTKDPISEADLKTLREQEQSYLEEITDATILSAIKVVHHMKELDDESYIEILFLTYISF